MAKTIWLIIDETENTRTEFTFYHFGKNPLFPSWYMEENHVYSIEMIFNLRLLHRFSTFFKCLTHCYIIKDAT